MSLRDSATRIAQRLQAGGFSAYLVGGCVRDQLLGREPKDFDIATNARPEQIEALFPHTIPVGRKFGVVVVVEEGEQFQVATFRAEADYRDGRHPEHVTFADAKADAVRRDFTINGLFLDPVTGQVHDWVGGQADMQARVIRTIGDPFERFAEDHLRLLRAIRFAAQLDFQIEPGTFAAVQKLAPKIQGISAERIREELMKLFRPPYAARGLQLFHESGLMQQVIPELSATVTCEQSPDFHPEGTVFQHLCLMLSFMPADASPILPWSVLMHDIAKPVTASKNPETGSIHFYGHERIGAEMAEGILQRLKFPRKQIEEIVTCVLHHMQFKDVKEMRTATRRRMLLRPTIAEEMALHRLDCLGSHADLEHYEFIQEQARELERKPALIPPLLNGHDLHALGISDGPAMGTLLAEVREKQLAEELATKEDALAWVKARVKGD